MPYIDINAYGLYIQQEAACKGVGVGGAERVQGSRANLAIVSISMPENPKALSPSTATTSLSVQVAAAIAYPSPTPMVPQVPASSLSLPSTAGSSISLQYQRLVSLRLMVAGVYPFTHLAE